MKVISDLLLAIDSKRCVLLIMSDLSAAFDMVEHSVLLHHLEKDFGISVVLNLGYSHTFPDIYSM